MQRRHIVLAAALLVLFSVWVLALSEYTGNTDPTNPPGSTSSYTLEDIYQRLNDGTAGTQSTFTEPAGGPGSTMHTLNDIMGVAPVADMTDGAVPGDVLVDKTYWGLRTDGTWGHQTGTMPAETVENTTVNQGAGYYNAFDLSTIDTDLAAGNIVKGVDIYGVTGTAERFTDNGDGTVTDSHNGLMWTKNANNGRMDWYDAMNYCMDLDLGGHDDWILPEVWELYTLVDRRESNPALPDGHPFTGVQNDREYWCITKGDEPAIEAYGVKMANGQVGSIFQKEYATLFVWPVRRAY